MARACVIALLVILWLPGLAGAEEPAGGKGGKGAEPLTIGVMEFEGKGEVGQDKADVMADILAEKVMRMGDVRVITKVDFLSILNIEKQKKLVGCGDAECVSEIGGALGVRWMVTGNVGMFGKTYLLNLKLMDVVNTEVASRVSRKIKGDEEDLLDALLEATTQLFEKVADRLQLVPTVAVAARRAQPISESPSAVTVFTRDEIRYSGATDLADLLRRVPGFDIYRLKPAFPLVGARALTDSSNNLILLLVDGRESLVELTGFAFWDSLSFDFEEVERVEVIRGPGSALYGANAFAGVVSVTTTAMRPESGARVYLSGGEIGGYRLFSRVQKNYSLKDAELSFGAGLGGEGIGSPSDAREMAVQELRTHAHLRYREKNRLDLSLSGGFVFGEGTAYLHIGDVRFTDAWYFFVMGDAKLELGSNARFKSQIYFTNYGTDMHYRTTLHAYDMWVADVPVVSASIPTVDGQVQLDWQASEKLLLIGGGNVRYTTLSGENFIISDDDEFRGGMFLHVRFNPWELVQLTGGLRLDLNTFSEAALSPRAALVAKPWANHSFRLGYGLAFRKPSFFEGRTHLRIENFNVATPEIVDKLARELGNEDLVNEKVHSFEAGWRGSFFDERLRVSLDLFYNLYQDAITFEVDVPTRMGLPDIRQSTIRYENETGRVTAIGGEAEASLRLAGSWRVWANLGLRRVTDSRSGGEVATEPHLRINLGGQFLPPSGVFADVALHYVSAYQMPLMDPTNILNNPEFLSLGEEILALARVGYRVPIGADLFLEAGVLARVGLKGDFREYAGAPIPSSLQVDSASDFGGEVLGRLVTFYLRGSI